MVLLRFTKFGRISVGWRMRNYSNKKQKEKDVYSPYKWKKKEQVSQNHHCSRAMLVYVSAILYSTHIYGTIWISKRQVMSSWILDMSFSFDYVQKQYESNIHKNHMCCWHEVWKNKSKHFFVRKWIASKMRIREMWLDGLQLSTAIFQCTETNTWQGNTQKKDAWIGGLGIEYRTLKSSGHLFPCIRVKIDSVRGILVAVSGRFRYYLEQKKTLHKFRGQITTKKQWRKNSPRFAEIFQKTET